MKGFKFDVSCQGFVTFRKPVNTAYLDTYPVPPVTTVLGMLSNALGLNRGDLRLQDYVKIGIRNHEICLHEEYVQLLKEPKSYFPDYMYDEKAYKKYLSISFLGCEDIEGGYVENFEEVINKRIRDNGYKPRTKVYEYSTSPMKQVVIVQPCYTIYAASENCVLLEKIRDSLKNPFRPLYIGSSDSIADVDSITDIIDIEKTTSTIIHTICKGIHEGGKMLKLPMRFEMLNSKINLVYTDILTMFDSYPTRLKNDEEDVFRFDDEIIYLM